MKKYFFISGIFLISAMLYGQPQPQSINATGGKIAKGKNYTLSGKGME